MRKANTQISGTYHLSRNLPQLDVDASIGKAELHQFAGRAQVTFQLLGFPVVPLIQPSEAPLVICGSKSRVECIDPDWIMCAS